MDTLAIILVSLVVILLAATGWAAFKRRQRVIDEPLYYFRCPGCRQRLRYRERQAGHSGMCRRCKVRFTFPPLPKVKPQT